MMTLQSVEELWMCLMLVATLLAQSDTAVLTPDQMDLLHQLRTRLHASGVTKASARQATADIDAFLATLDEG